MTKFLCDSPVAVARFWAEFLTMITPIVQLFFKMTMKLQLAPDGDCVLASCRSLCQKALILHSLIENRTVQSWLGYFELVIYQTYAFV